MILVRMCRHLLGLMGVSLKIRACQQEEKTNIFDLAIYLFLCILLQCNPIFKLRFPINAGAECACKPYLLQHSTLLQMLEWVRPTA